MKGRKDTISPITTPVGVNTKADIGLSIKPKFIRRSFRTPFLDKIGLKANILIISDTIKGRINNNITLC
jgi:hypothetical protein